MGRGAETWCMPSAHLTCQAWRKGVLPAQDERSHPATRRRRPACERCTAQHVPNSGCRQRQARSPGRAPHLDAVDRPIALPERLIGVTCSRGRLRHSRRMPTEHACQVAEPPHASSEAARVVTPPFADSAGIHLVLPQTEALQPARECLCRNRSFMNRALLCKPCCTPKPKQLTCYGSIDRTELLRGGEVKGG